MSGAEQFYLAMGITLLAFVAAILIAVALDPATYPDHRVIELLPAEVTQLAKAWGP